MIINLGFKGRRASNKNLPPGQHETRGFPVLSLGPTPEIETSKWKMTIDGLVNNTFSLDLKSLKSLQSREIVCDIHCVTRWSKFETRWIGVSLDTLFSKAGIKDGTTTVIAHSADGYSTNIPLKDLRNEQGFIVYSFDGKPIEAIHGGPVRLLVPHLYFWKSAKWLTGLTILDHDEPGFWETRGYHNYGDPWKEQRYTND